MGEHFNCGVLLDMDGLLLDTERLSCSVWKEARDKFGAAIPDAFLMGIIGQNLATIRNRLVAELSASYDWDTFLNKASIMYKEAINSGALKTKAGAHELLSFLKRSNIPYCLCTSSGRQLVANKLKITGLTADIPLRVCGDEVMHGKPSPEIYLKGAELIGLPPELCFAFEDSPNGLRAAIDAGCFTYHIQDLVPVSKAFLDEAQGTLDDLLAAIPLIESARKSSSMPSRLRPIS